MALEGSDGALGSQTDQIFMKTSAVIIRLLNGTGRAVVNLLGLPSRGGHAMVHSEEELKMLVTASQEASARRAEEQIIHHVASDSPICRHGAAHRARREIEQARRREKLDLVTPVRVSTAARLPR